MSIGRPAIFDEANGSLDESWKLCAGSNTGMLRIGFCEFEVGLEGCCWLKASIGMSCRLGSIAAYEFVRLLLLICF